MSERLLTIEKVIEVTTLSETEIGRREKRGEFPARIKLSPKRTAWVGSEIDAWVQATIKTARGEDSGKSQ